MNTLRTRLFSIIAAAVLCLATAPQGASALNLPAPGVGKQDCTYTIGYWKTHPDAWPITTLTLGSVTYNQAQLELILNQPVQGNGLVNLAQQLIAAKFNVAQGADPTPVAKAIEDADKLIAGLVCPPIGTGMLLPSQVSPLVKILDEYNNGLLGPYHCGSKTSSRRSTWGTVKSFYR